MNPYTKTESEPHHERSQDPSYEECPFCEATGYHKRRGIVEDFVTMAVFVIVVGSMSTFAIIGLTRIAIEKGLITKQQAHDWGLRL